MFEKLEFSLSSSMSGKDITQNEGQLQKTDLRSIQLLEIELAGCKPNTWPDPGDICNDSWPSSIHHRHDPEIHHDDLPCTVC